MIEVIGLLSPDRFTEVEPRHYATVWHYDLGYGSEYQYERYSTSNVIMWASQNPTEILDHDGSTFTPEPCQIIQFTNGDHLHRTPLLTEDDAENRWFARSFYHMPVQYGSSPRSD